MAKNTSIIKIQGTLGDLSFYKSIDGDIVRKKWGPDKKRINSDPSFASLKRNQTEFGAAAKCGSLVKNALRDVIWPNSDSRMTGRLNAAMAAIKNLDTTSAWGSRKVSVGIKDAGAEAVLCSLVLNKQTRPGLLKKTLNFDKLKERLEIKTFQPKIHVAGPAGYTHVRLRFMCGLADFSSGKYVRGDFVQIDVSRKAAAKDLALQLPGTLKGKGVRFYGFGISFLQLINGQMYEFEDMSRRHVEIVGVAP